MSSYPDNCKLQIERRTVPPETGQDVANEIGSLLERLAAADPAFQATSKITFVRNPWQATMEAEIVAAVRAAAEVATGRPTGTMTQTGWLDSALLGDAGIPTIVFGPAGQGAHAAVEWADLASLHVCTQVYADVIAKYCA